MKQWFAKLFSLSILIVTCVSSVHGQKAEITLGPDQISQRDVWTITLTVYDAPLKSYDKFPDIKGFRKGSAERQFFTTSAGGRISSVESVAVRYSPLKTGIITVNPFGMRVNDKYIKVNGKEVTVVAPVQYSNPNRNKPYRTPDDFFQEEDPYFVEAKDDAFLMLTTDKSEVYVGEGFNVTLAFYMTESNVSLLRFHELSTQMTEVVKKLKPANSWEENFNIESVDDEFTTVNGRPYLKFKIYQATFYPFNSQSVHFPSVELDMIKMKVARNPSLYRANTIEGLKSYSSKPVTVKVKDLPAHPLKSSVTVGEFKLNEHLMKDHVQTGESVSYEFNISGEGNISSIAKPSVKNDDNFEIYEPNSTQEIGRSRNKIFGTKSFRYFMIPRDPGSYKLSPYFEWIFFSPSKRNYDTLRSSLTLNVKGVSRKNEESNDPGGFYDKIEIADNALNKIDRMNWEKWAFNGFLLMMVSVSAFLLFKK